MFLYLFAYRVGKNLAYELTNEINDALKYLNNYPSTATQYVEYKKFLDQCIKRVCIQYHIIINKYTGPLSIGRGAMVSFCPRLSRGGAQNNKIDDQKKKGHRKLYCRRPSNFLGWPCRYMISKTIQ